jgi:hypothetical protein
MKKKIDMIHILPYILDEDFKVVTDTNFDENMIEYVYEIKPINLDYIIPLKLGVIRFEDDGQQYVYNADKPHEDSAYSDYIEEEVLRMCIYYQLTHPNYVDNKLDVILNSTKGGEEHIRSLIIQDQDRVINDLKEIFKSQKGRNDNVIEFKKKVV